MPRIACRRSVAVARAYTSLIGFFSAQGPLAGRFKVRTCFYPGSQGDPAYVSLSVLEEPPKFEPNVSPSANNPIIPSRSSASRSAALLCFHSVESYTAYDGLPVRRPSRTPRTTDFQSVAQVVQVDQSARRTGSPSYKAIKT